MEPTTGREGKPKRKRILSDVTKQKNKERRKNWKKNSKKERIQLETELQTAMEEKRSLEQVVTAGAHLNHHEVTMAAVASTNLSSVTLKGIKKYHKFTTSKEKNIIYAYSDSKQVEYDHRYLPRDVVQLDDIEFE
jgi:hypothetical protein